MISSFIPYIALWAVLVLGMIGLIVYRKTIASHEDDALHLSQAGAATQQVSVAQKLDQVDKWGKLLTIIVVVYGFALGGAYLYESWVAGSRGL